MQSCMIFVPFIGWLVAVIIKFITNYIYYSTLDLKLSFSNGGFPSVHTATIITTTTYIGFYDNFNSPLTGREKSYKSLVSGFAVHPAKILPSGYSKTMSGAETAFPT